MATDFRANADLILLAETTEDTVYQALSSVRFF